MKLYYLFIWDTIKLGYNDHRLIHVYNEQNIIESFSMNFHGYNE